jgi:hypothetical protein
MNKKIVALVAVIALVLVVAGTAGAAVKQGDKEVTFSGAYATLQTNSDNTDIGNLTATMLQGSFGYFVSDEIELSAKGTGAWLKIGDADTNLYGIGADVKYHFQPGSSTVPYVGGQWVYLHGKVSGDIIDISDSVSGSMYGPIAGVKFFVTDSTILFVEYQYDLFTGDVKDGIKNANVVYAGLAFKF